MKYCLGIDIGGTKTAVGIADKELKLIATVTFATEPQLGAESLVKRIGDVCEKLLSDNALSKADIAFAGVASPGPLDIKNGRIVHIATMDFANVPIKAMLEKQLGLPVFLENDANCAALAESIMGEGQGQDPVVYVTVSTGIGCGIVIGGKILSGAYSSAGEIGHITVEPDGRQCPCGKKGCLELYSSGTAIGKDATAKRGMPTDAKTVFALARQGDKAMKEIVNSAADKLALALSGVIHLIDPEVIVLGGSVIKDFDILSTPLKAAIEKYTQPVQGREVNIKISPLGGEQVLLGALVYGKGESNAL